MKKNVMSMAVAATVAATGAYAQDAVFRNVEGTGQALIFPFYDAENGNATNFHIVNTTDRAIAAKIRFREYKASEEVLDFNIYMSKEDHFAFGVIKDPNGDGAAIITSDNTCTVPALGQPNNGYDGTTTENADGSITRIQPFTPFLFQINEWVDDSMERTLRGYVEVIQMGILHDNDGNPLGNDLEKAKLVESFATHGADGVPANCAGLTGAFLSNALWGTNPGSFGISAPQGGLYGLAYHINVEDAAAWGFEPVALDDVFETQQHATPGDDEPNFGSANTKSIVILGDGNSTTFTWPLGIDAVTSTMMTHQVMNDVAINPAIGGQTDWVTTFPNKYAYVNTGTPIAPFTKGYFGAKLNSAKTAYEEKRACEPLSIETWDREEAITIDDVGFSPRPPGVKGDELCDEQTLVHWGVGSTSALNAEREVTNLGYAYTEGWARWTFDATAKAGGTGFAHYSQALCTSTPNTCLLGLPAVGFGAYKYANGSSGNVLMNYGHAADHKTNVVCSSGGTSSSSGVDCATGETLIEST